MAHRALGAALAAFAFANPALAECSLTKVATLPLTVSGSRLYVPVSMNETEGKFLLDTGSELTLLNGDYATRAHVGMDRHAGQLIYSGAGGRETLRVNQAHVRHIEVGGISFQDWEFPVLPDAAGGIGKTGGDGILGMDFLHYFDIDMDIEAGKLNLWRLSGCRDIHPEWQGTYDAIPLTHTAHQSVTLPIMVDNAFLDVVFDTGADGVLLTRAAGARAGVTDAALSKDIEGTGRGLGGHFPSVVHHFQMLAVGSGTFDKPAVLIETESHRTAYADGLIDWRYLKAKKLWISYGTNTLFVQKAGG